MAVWDTKPRAGFPNDGAKVAMEFSIEQQGLRRRGGSVVEVKVGLRENSSSLCAEGPSAPAKMDSHPILHLSIVD